MKKIVIVGATSVIAEQCARQWLEGSDAEVVLLGRDLERVKRVADDLAVRFPNSKISSMYADFQEPAEINAIAHEIVAQGDIDLVLIAHGYLSDQMKCQESLELCRDALYINGISPVLYAEAFANLMERANSGTMILISSVAGDRGRKSNYVYGSAKSLISSYAQGLQHRFSASNVKIVLVKPGPTDTPMTAHLKNQGVELASAIHVAREIVTGAEKGKLCIYTPKKWRIIMGVLRHLPAGLFNRLDI